MAGGTVNKVAYDFASLELEFAIPGGPSLGLVTGFNNIEYNDNVDRTLQYGSDRVPEDATDGVYKADGNVEFWRWQYHPIVATLKQNQLGFYQVEFTVTVNYAHKGEPLHTDTIQRVMFADRKHSAKQGADPLSIPCGLFIKDRIFVDGVGPFGETL